MPAWRDSDDCMSLAEFIIRSQGIVAEIMLALSTSKAGGITGLLNTCTCMCKRGWSVSRTMPTLVQLHTDSRIYITPTMTRTKAHTHVSHRRQLLIISLCCFVPPSPPEKLKPTCSCLIFGSSTHRDKTVSTMPLVFYY